MRPVLLFVLFAAAAAPTCFAQIPAALPYERTLDLLVIDNISDCVWRLADRDQDGSWHDAGEVTLYYQNGVGGLAMTFPRTIATAPDGSAIVFDSQSNSMLWLRDENGDGDALDNGEQRLFFDNSNLSGVPLEAASGMTIAADGRVFVAAQNTAVASDAILVLADLNGDGDANDAGEARPYCVIPGSSGAISDSRPSELLVGPDGDVYYVDNGSGVAQGVYRLTDLNLDGDCNDPGEVAPFWLLSPPNAAFWIAFAVDADGAFYLGDLGGVWQVRRALDSNGDGVIGAGEDSLFLSVPGQLASYDLLVQDDGTLLAPNSLQPLIIAMRDEDGDGAASGSGEAGVAYNASLALGPAVNPRGAALLRAPTLSVAPSSTPIGTTATFRVRTETPFDLAAVFLSLSLAPAFDLPPFGRVEIDATAFVGIGFGLSDSQGIYSQPFAVPADPSLVHTFAAQAWCGDDFRQFLSNAIELTITP